MINNSPGASVWTDWLAIFNHVQLIISEFEPAGDDAKRALGVPEGEDLLTAVIVESTPFTPIGFDKAHYVDDATGSEWDSYWHTANYYFTRNESGNLRIVGVKPWHTRAPPTPEPHDTRAIIFVMHPFRESLGKAELDKRAFHEAVRMCELESRKYGAWQCIRAWYHERVSLEPSMFPDEASRAKLRGELHRRWKNKPICVSVAVRVWQRYFEIVRGGAETPEDTDLAVQDILKYMPVFSDATSPSWLVKVLTSQSGWLLREELREVELPAAKA